MFETRAVAVCWAKAALVGVITDRGSLLGIPDSILGGSVLHYAVI